MKRRRIHLPGLLIGVSIGLIAFYATKPGSHRTPSQPPVDSVPVKTTNGGVATASGFPRLLTDGRGKAFTIKAAPAHIISLAPSVTEILYALNQGDKLAADTPSCDYPPDATRKPHVDPLNGDREKIEAHNPDLILAVDKLDSPKLIVALEQDGFPVVVMKAEDLQQTYDGIKLIGQATGQETAAAQIVQTMQTRLSAVENTVRAVQDKPGVLMMYGDNPIYTTGAGSYLTDIIRIAGGTNIVTEPLPSEVIASEKVVLRHPDVIICSKTLIPKVKQLPGWNVVPAVAQERFYQTSNASPLMRPGPRLAEAAEDLARYLHPDLFPK